MFSGPGEAPFVFAPNGRGTTDALLPDGSPRLGGVCECGLAMLISREEFDKLAVGWALK